MKKLEKLRLINWHLFTNTTTNIENLTFLTGANGTGKSTIIDALQIVLLGDTSGRNFNKAANEKTGGRTLIGYLRCETGKTPSGEPIYMRKGSFSSYVCCQFYDDVADKHFTIGIAFDIIGSENKDQSFFYLDKPFPENNFTNVDLIDSSSLTRPMTIKEFTEYCKNTYQKDDYKFFETNTSYHSFIKDLLGNLPEKFFTLFKKAVSFTPISDISKFITEFICDVDHHIDITPMQRNIEQYKILEIEAKKLEDKINELENIKTTYEEFSKIMNVAGSFNYMVDKFEFEHYRDKCIEINEKIRNYEKDQINIDIEIQDNKANIDSLKQERDAYLQQKLSDTNFSVSDKLKEKQTKLRNEMIYLQKNIEQSYHSINEYAAKYQYQINNFLTRYRDKKLDFLSERLTNQLNKLISYSEEFSSQCSHIQDLCSVKQITNEQLEEFQLNMTDYRSLLNKVFTLLDDEAMQKSDELNEINSNINRMTSGEKPFPQAYLQIKNEFEARLKERHHDVKVSIYCDLVDVTDPEWSLALECALLAQKLNIFVNDKYFTEASKLLGEICKQNDFYAISLIDSEKLIDNSITSREDSVARLIKTDHHGARAYTDFLLGKIKKCSTFEEAREAGTGLLSNCTGYRNYTSWYLDQRKGSKRFLGTKINKDTQFSFKEDLNALNKELSYYSDIQTCLSNILSISSLSDYELTNLKEKLSKEHDISTLNQEINRLEDQKNEKTLSNVNEIQEKIDAIEQDIKDLENKNVLLYGTKGANTNNIQKLKMEDLPRLQTLRDDKQNVLLTKYDPKLVSEVYEKELENILQTISKDDLKEQIDKRKAQVLRKINQVRSDLIRSRTNYNAKYNLSYDALKEDSNEDYDKEYTSLKDVLLPSYQQKIKSAHEKAVKEFKDDFIYKIRNSINSVYSQIDELNIALKDCHFGRDSYKFSITPDPTYIDYYNMFTDELLVQIGDTSDEYLEKYQDKMDELFLMISDSSDLNKDEKEIVLQNIEKFTDYRTYLNFDLLVTKGDDGRTTSLSHTFKTTSGGESQTPFYISILASFAQLYRVNQPGNDNTIRLVIFDEAFSKMDGGRIKEACTLLKQFGLQAILSTPSEKLRDLVNSVDLILVAIHDESKGVRSYLDVYKDTTKPNEEIKSVFAPINKEENTQESEKETKTNTLEPNISEEEKLLDNEDSDFYDINIKEDEESEENFSDIDDLIPEE